MPTTRGSGRSRYLSYNFPLSILPIGSSPENAISYAPKIRDGSLIVGLDWVGLEVTDCAAECSVTMLV